MKYAAKYRKGRALIISNVIFTLLAVWAVRHVYGLITFAHGYGTRFTLIFAFAFIALVWQMLLACLERPYKTSPEQQAQLAKLRTVLNVPVCNEDPEALRDCLQSIFEQTRKVDLVHVVVNGPNKVDYTELEQWALTTAGEYDIELHWDTQPIPGKRQAQGTTAREFLGPNDIFVTIDSDAYLDAHAVEEGLKPFVKQNIKSVAGMVLTMNNRAKLITRLADLWFGVGQLVDRSSFSVLGQVIVNSGVLALYRGYVVLENLDGYTHETFFGRGVEISDDSLLTIYALREGRCVQQPTAFAFTLMPETFSHHLRQQVRWMRGAFIRAWWRFKYLPLKSYAFWGHALGWMQLFLSSFVFATLFIYLPVKYHLVLPWLLVVPLLIGYGQSLRYFVIWRSDETLWYRFVTFLMQPIAALWCFFVLRCVRYYSIATCLRTGWGTRQNVEVVAHVHAETV
jgi:hyaluronan synthase